MIRMQTLAKIMLIALGIHTCIRLLGLVPSSFYGFTTGKWESVVLSFVGLILAGLLLAVTIKLLIINSGYFAQRMVPVEPPQEVLPDMHWLTLVFRLICIGAGIFYFVLFTTEVARHISVIGMSYNNPFTARQYLAAPVLRWLLTLPIAIYLLCGAPHFVRWQVKKTLEICRKDTSSVER